MQHRQNLIDLFSTFIQFFEDRFSSWVTDFKLKKNMTSYLQKEPGKENSEKFWSLFWYQQWKNNTNVLAKNHLLAYLQEPCYWASQNVVTKFTNLQYKLSDYFQMAIAQSEQVLNTYNVYSGLSLSSFANWRFRSIITNILRQKSATDICTDWALLRKVRKKRLRASLENAGFNRTKVDQYCLIWMCFQTIYAPKQQKGTQKLPAPDTDTWLKIISAYQQQAINYPQLKAENSNINIQMLKEIVLESAKLIRQYLYPQTNSLNLTPTGSNSGELLDIITSDDLSPLEKVINIEEVNNREKNYSQINQILTEALKQLNPEFQHILELYYRENLTQQSIAKRLAIKQYTISRKMTRAREFLLKALIKWSQDSLHITIDTDKIKGMSTILEEWMINYYTKEC